METDKRIEMVEAARELFGKAPFDGAEEMDNYRSYKEIFEQQINRTAEAVKITRENDKFRFAHMAQKVQMADLFETNGVASIHV
jgi:hypothetical protein